MAAVEALDHSQVAQELQVKEALAVAGIVTSTALAAAGAVHLLLVQMRQTPMLSQVTAALVRLLL